MTTRHEIYKENDNTYVSISFTNQTLVIGSDNIGEQSLDYSVTKTVPIVDNASEYYASIVRFSIPLGTIPITIFPVIPGQGMGNLSTLRIGIRNGTTGSTQLNNLIYVPQNLTQQPNQNNPNAQVITPYYWVYSYEQIIVMINTALKAAYTTYGLTNTAPYFIYTPSTELISLIVGNEFNVAGGPQVIINYDMLQYINAFDVSGVGNGIYVMNVFGVVNESFAYYPNGQTPPATTVPPAAPAIPYFYKITQEYTYLQNWNPIRRILFLSNTLPIRHEVVPCNNITQNNDGVYSTLPVLAEFEPLVNTAGDQREVAYYVTNGNYGLRLIDMTTPTPIYRLDLRVYWQDIANNVYPLLIPNFQQANITLGFIRKTLYKNLIV